MLLLLLEPLDSKFQYSKYAHIKYELYRAQSSIRIRMKYDYASISTDTNRIIYETCNAYRRIFHLSLKIYI